MPHHDRRQALCACALLTALLAGCGSDDSAPLPADSDPCAPSGHIHREPGGDWCHCDRGYVAATDTLACVTDPDYDPNRPFDFGDLGEHACWHVTNGPYAEVAALAESAPAIDRFHTHYTLTLRDVGGGMFGGTFTYNARSSGNYVVYLSREIAFGVQEGELDVASVATAPTAACEGLATMIGYVFAKDVTYTMTFGPDASAEVAVVIEELL